MIGEQVVGRKLVGALARSCVLAATAGALLAWPAGATLLPQIHTVAGGGSCSGSVLSGGPCDNVPATSVSIDGARSGVPLPGGGFAYVDWRRNIVREVSPSGIATTVAGDGTTTDGANGVIAIHSGLNGPVAVTPLPGGGLLITEYDGGVVRRVSAGPPGLATITTIAGTGANGGAGGLSGAATSIELNFPSDAELTSDGHVLIADNANNYIRELDRADTGATMSTIAGGGLCASVTQCDGKLPTDVALNAPVSVSPIAGGSGGYLIGEYANNAVRKVSASDSISLVAGNGSFGAAGDGGPATAAQLASPEKVSATPEGSILIADANNDRIRSVSPSGVITTVAGTGAVGAGGDGGPATSAEFVIPGWVAPTSDGGFLVSDYGNSRIRLVPAPPTTTIAVTPTTPTGTGGWYTSAVHVTVSELNSAQTRCTADPPAAPTSFDVLPPSCSFAGAGADIIGDGSHALYAASVNAAGDKEPPATVAFRLDRTPPTLTCRGAPSFPVTARDEVVTATVKDVTSGPVTSLVSTSADTSRVGRHVARLSGSDNAGLAAGIRCPYAVLPVALKPAPAVSWHFSPHRRYSTITQLVVTNVPRRASVKLTCRGKGCPFSRRSPRAAKCTRNACKKVRSLKFGLTPLFARARLAVGAKLTVSVTKSNTIGRVWLFTVRAGKDAAYRAACLAPGSSVPGHGC